MHVHVGINCNDIVTRNVRVGINYNAVVTRHCYSKLNSEKFINSWSLIMKRLTRPEKESEHIK